MSRGSRPPGHRLCRPGAVARPCRNGVGVAGVLRGLGAPAFESEADPFQQVGRKRVAGVALGTGPVQPAAEARAGVVST